MILLKWKVYLTGWFRAPNSEAEVEGHIRTVVMFGFQGKRLSFPLTKFEREHSWNWVVIAGEPSIPTQLSKDYSWNLEWFHLARYFWSIHYLCYSCIRIISVLLRNYAFIEISGEGSMYPYWDQILSILFKEKYLHIISIILFVAQLMVSCNQFMARFLDQMFCEMPLKCVQAGQIAPLSLAFFVCFSS